MVYSLQFILLPLVSVLLTTAYISSDECGSYQKPVPPDSQPPLLYFCSYHSLADPLYRAFTNHNLLTTAYVACYSLFHSLQLISGDITHHSLYKLL